MTKTITCPHCEKDIKVSAEYTLEVASVYSDVFDEATWERVWLESLSPEDRTTVTKAVEGGLIEPWAETFKEAHGATVRRPKKAFLAWLRTSKPKLVPSFAVQYFGEAHGGRITYVAAQSVGAVICEGLFKEFVPDRTINGESVGKGGGKKLRISQGSLSELMNWTRTKYGYVAGKGALHSQLSRRSYGDFARPAI